MGIIKNILAFIKKDTSSLSNESNQKNEGSLIEEKIISTPVSDICSVIHNKPNGFYLCCSTGFRFIGAGAAPYELNCPECGRIMANYAIENSNYIADQLRLDPRYLETIFENTKHYHPVLCEYLRYLKKQKNYLGAIEKGWQVNERGKVDNFKGTGPIDIICECYLELSEVERKSGNIEKYDYYINEYHAIQKNHLGNDIIGKRNALLNNIDAPIQSASDGYDIYFSIEAEVKGLVDSQMPKEQCEKYIKLLFKALSVDISPNTKAKANRLLADLYLKLNDKDNEIKHLKKAIVLNPKIGVKKRIEKYEKSIQSKFEDTSNF